MNEQTNSFIDAMGAMGESAAFFRDQLIEKGFTRREALELVKTFVAATFSRPVTKEET